MISTFFLLVYLELRVILSTKVCIISCIVIPVLSACRPSREAELLCFTNATVNHCKLQKTKWWQLKALLPASWSVITCAHCHHSTRWLAATVTSADKQLLTEPLQRSCELLSSQTWNPTSPPLQPRSCTRLRRCCCGHQVCGCLLPSLQHPALLLHMHSVPREQSTEELNWKRKWQSYWDRGCVLGSRLSPVKPSSGWRCSRMTVWLAKGMCHSSASMT